VSDTVTDSARVLLVPFIVAVRVVFWAEVTAAEVAVKVAVVDEAGTVTDAGTVTAKGTLLVNATTAPPDGAALDSVTVQDMVPDGAIELFGHCSDVRLATGATVRVVVWLAPLSVAVMIALCAEVTVAAVAVKLAVVEEAGIVTVDGTVMAEVLLLDSVIVVLEAPARAKVTVQEVVPDGRSDVDVHCTDESVPLVTLATSDSGALALDPFRVAVTVADWSVLKVPAVALKVAVDALAATLAEDGTVIGPVEPRLTAVAAVTALLNATVQTARVCGPKEEGAQLTLLTVGKETGEPLLALPPVAVTLSGVLSIATSYGPLIPITAELTELASVTATLATTPFPITLVFMPEARHV
jgi:hypothetical protein